MIDEVAAWLEKSNHQVCENISLLPSSVGWGTLLHARFNVQAPQTNYAMTGSRVDQVDNSNV
jgi:hypothetical protein